MDALARAHPHSSATQSVTRARSRVISVGGHDLWLLKPQTFMNRSGHPSIRALVDSAQGRCRRCWSRTTNSTCRRARRLKFGGGHGGHNGLRDTITHCGDDFWRLRLASAIPGGTKDQVIDYVLQRAAPTDEAAIVDPVGAALEARRALQDGAEKARCTHCTRRGTDR